MNQYLHKRTVATLLLACTAVVIFGVIWYGETRSLVVSIRLVNHAQQVLSELEGMSSSSSGAMVMARDYVNTGNEGLLQSYNDAEKGLREHLRKARELLAEDTAGQQLLDQLESQLETRLTGYRRAIAERKEHGPAAAHDLLQNLAVGQISRVNPIARMREAERERIDQQVGAAAAASYQIIRLGALFSAVALAFFGLFAYFLQTDFRARKRAEQALKHNEEQIRSILEQAQDAHMVVDSLGFIKTWNLQAEAMFGWTAAEAIGRPAAATILAVKWRSLLGTTLSSPQAFQQKLLYRRVRTNGLHRDGHEFPAELTVSQIESEGTSIFSIFLRDVTEQHQAEQALRRSEGRHRLLFEASPMPMWVLDLQTTKFLAVNEAARRHYGYTQEQFMVMSAKDLRPPEEVPKLLKSLADLRTDAQHVILTRHRKADGELVDVEVTANGLLFGNVVASLVIVKDVTSRLRAESELKQAHERLRVSVKQLEQRERDITLLSEMGDLLQSCPSFEEAFAVVMRCLPPLMPDCSGALYMFGTGQNVVERVAAWGRAEEGETMFSAEDCWALRRGRVHVVEPGGSAPPCKHVASRESSSYICVPVTAQGGEIGSLHVQLNPEAMAAANRAPTSSSEERMAVAAAEQIALALANLKLRETLRNQSIRDPLTNLFNRRYMEEAIERELRRASRNRHPLGVIMADIDRFKQFNDTFGHKTGDEILRLMARYLEESIRLEDVACRFGGEEFVLLLPNSALEDTVSRAEQLRRGARELQLKRQSQIIGNVSLSLGVAAYPVHGIDADSLLRVADESLYRAKSLGRDQVVVGAPPMCTDIFTP